MKHIIVSRVNIPRELDETHHKEPYPYKKKEWNKERFYLLNNILRPSLNQQTNQNFIFISLWGEVYNGGELNNEVKEKVVRGLDTEDEKPFNFEKWKENGKKVKEEMDFAAQIKNIVSKYTNENELTLITNVDCDDAVNKEFVEKLQKSALLHDKSKVPYYLDVKRRFGINLYTGVTGDKTKKNTPSPSVSTIEKQIECFPLKYHHPMLKDYVEGRKVQGTAVLQSVNDGNIFSKGKGKKQVDLKIKDFSPNLRSVINHYATKK